MFLKALGMNAACHYDDEFGLYYFDDCYCYRHSVKADVVDFRISQNFAQNRTTLEPHLKYSEAVKLMQEPFWCGAS